MDATVTPQVSAPVYGRVATANSNVSTLYCMIHRYALFAKTLPPEFNSVHDDAVAMVNLLKFSFLNTSMLRFLCQ